MIKKIVSGKISVIVVAFAFAAAIVGFNFYEGVSAQSNEVKAVTDVLTREAQAVKKRRFNCARQNLGEQRGCDGF